MLQAVFAGGCQPGDKGLTQASAAIVTYGPTGAPVAGSKAFFKLAKGHACIPNLY